MHAETLEVRHIIWDKVGEERQRIYAAKFKSNFRRFSKKKIHLGYTARAVNPYAVY